MIVSVTVAPYLIAINSRISNQPRRRRKRRERLENFLSLQADDGKVGVGESYLIHCFRLATPAAHWNPPSVGIGNLIRVSVADRLRIEKCEFRRTLLECFLSSLAESAGWWIAKAWEISMAARVIDAPPQAGHAHHVRSPFTTRYMGCRPIQTRLWKEVVREVCAHSEQFMFLPFPTSPPSLQANKS